MKRGDVYIAVAPGEFGKPRPAVVVQSEVLGPNVVGSVLVCPITSHLEIESAFRMRIAPTSGNGLKSPSMVMADKLQAISIRRIRQRIGALTPLEVSELDQTLSFVLGL